MKLDAASRISFARPFFLTAVLVVSIITIVLFPLFTLFFQYTAFSDFLDDLTLNKAVGLANSLAAMIAFEDQALEQGFQNREIVRRIQRVERDARFSKMRIYSPTGKILYSSDAEEIGSVNRDPYFRELLERPRIMAKQIESGGRSLEQQYMTADLVEAYVPIVRSERLLGVFEIYYDIGPEKRKLKAMNNFSTGVLSGMAAVLLIAVIISVSRATQYLRDRQRVLEELRALSLSDELTALYNRRGFFVLAEQQIKIAKRAQRSMLLVSADLDGLKRINDGFGHHEGDRALVDAAQILRQSFRESDIIARIGGDEFVVLITEKPDISAEVLFERLSRNLETHNRKVTRPYPFSISMGVVSFDPQNPVSLNELLVQADKAMYEHKRQRSGRSRSAKSGPRSESERA